jgi:hypothetical protein
MNNKTKLSRNAMYVKAFEALCHSYKNGQTIIDRELSVFASFVDYHKSFSTNPEVELRSSDKYIGRPIKDYII